jgi:hypothetical protein
VDKERNRRKGTMKRRVEMREGRKGGSNRRWWRSKVRMTKRRTRVRNRNKLEELEERGDRSGGKGGWEDEGGGIEGKR